MTDYNFFADLFDTYQSLPDWLKLAWLLVPALVILCGLMIWRRPRWGKSKSLKGHFHVCSVFADKDGTIKLFAGDDIFNPVATQKLKGLMEREERAEVEGEPGRKH